MKKDNSTLNRILAIMLLATSIIIVLFILGGYSALILIPSLSYAKQVAWNKWDFHFWSFAWTMLSSYLAVLSIEWLKGKSIKNDMINTLTFILAMGVWGIIREKNIDIFSIVTFVFYGIILLYLYTNKTKKLLT